MNRSSLVVGALVFALAGGLALWQAREPPDPAISPAALQAAAFPDLNGEPRALGQWQGKVVVLNFWATWCAPCREEIPLLNRLQDRRAAQGVQVVGLALDERSKVVDFAREVPIHYPVLMGEIQAMSFARRLGNRHGVLPYTVFIDRGGRPAASVTGALTEAKIEQTLASLL